LNVNFSTQFSTKRY